MEMENVYTSTPISKSKSHRSSSFLQEATNTLHKKKRNTSLVNQSVTVEIEVNDELERAIRRSRAELIQRLSYLSSPQSPQVLDEKQIRDHFQICLKMYAENKINAKNVWNLKIIDYMRTVLYSHGLNKDSLQVASTSLDVSAKIYGLRVDDIHSAILKLASNMARIQAQQDAENIDEDNEYMEPDDNGKSRISEGRKKNRRRLMFRENKTTTAKDPNSLLGDVPKLESVFFQTHINLESSSIDNLFTNKFPMNHGRYKFMFLSKETAWASYNKKDENINFDTKYPCRIYEIRNLEICSPFHDFEIDEWDPEQEARMLNERSHMTIDFQEQLFHKRSNEEVVYDIQGFPIPELDGSIHDIFENGLDENANNIPHGAVLAEQVARIEDFNPGNRDLQLNEYCYTNAFVGKKLMLQVWAGPSHWKLKYVRRSANQFSGKPEKQSKKARKRNKIQPSLIDYNIDTPPYDKTKFYTPKNIKIDTTPHKCTLPQVMHPEQGLYRSLMLKPFYLRLDRHNSSSADDGDPEINSYNYENPNDNLYCSQQQTNASFFTEHDNDHHQNEEETTLSLHNFQNNLIAMPELVPKSYIAYALHPKRMDMKRLKKAVWRTLVNIQPHEMITDGDMYKREVQKKTFSEIYQEIPSIISAKMQKELSCPLVFVALLHLCNEHNLAFGQESDLDDFTVEKLKHFQS